MKRTIILIIVAVFFVGMGILFLSRHQEKLSGMHNSSTTSDQFLPRESWTLAGYDTPESAFQSACWAESKGDWNAYLNSMTTEFKSAVEKHVAGRSDSVNVSNMQKEAVQIAAFQIISNQTVSADECILHISSPKLGKGKVTLQKIGNEWKLAGDVTADK